MTHRNAIDMEPVLALLLEIGGAPLEDGVLERFDDAVVRTLRAAQDAERTAAMLYESTLQLHL
jgi:hypothetical protein